MKIVLCLLIALVPLTANASTIVSTNKIQCGPFLLTLEKGGMFNINGITPASQKIDEDKSNPSNSTFYWMVAYPNVGWLGMNFYVGSDQYRYLDVQYIQPDMDDPKIYGQYECVPVRKK